MVFSLYSFQNLFQLCFSKPENQDLKTSNKVLAFFYWLKIDSINIENSYYTIKIWCMLSKI